MIAFPLAAAAISVLFSVALLRRFGRRRRLAELAWGVALAQYAVASLAVAAGVGGGWDPTLYRIFWLFGALLNVPWLALGSIALLGNKVASMAALVLVAVGSVWALVAVGGGDLDRVALETRQIPKGSDVWCSNAAFTPSCDPARSLARLYSLPSFAIVALIAVLSGRRRRGVRPPPERVRANWIIAAGVTLNAIGGFALVSKGRGGPFSIVLAVSVTVMFAGFVLASRQPQAETTPPAPAG